MFGYLKNWTNSLGQNNNNNNASNNETKSQIEYNNNNSTAGSYNYHNNNSTTIHESAGSPNNNNSTQLNEDNNAGSNNNNTNTNTNNNNHESGNISSSSLLPAIGGLNIGGGVNSTERHCFSISGRIFNIDKKYKPLKKMGSGAYGMVITATDTLRNSKVAIKKIENLFDNLHDAKRILREVKLMQHLDHKNVLKLIDMIEPPQNEDFNDIYLVTEAMQSDLHRIICSDNVLSDDHTQYVIYQILSGLKHLHSANIIHRDLKPANILINEDCSVKICDLGLARGVASQVKEDIGPLTEYVVTRWYRAPEVITAAQNYGYEIDIWSVGCIMAEIINREPLFQGTSYVDQLNTIFNVIGTPTDSDLESCTNAKAVRYIQKLQRRSPMDLSRLIPDASPLAIDLMSRMLTFDPRRRITVDEALNHPYFDAWRTSDLHECENGPFDFSFEEYAVTRPQLENQLLNEVGRFRPESLINRQAANTTAKRSSIIRNLTEPIRKRSVQQ